jgi:hypothetical protein
MQECTPSGTVLVAARSLRRKLGDRPLDAVVVDECLACGGGGDQHGDGGVVECTRNPET